MRLLLYIILFILLSCENEKKIEGRLEVYSKLFIEKKKIDLSDYKKEYYITKGSDYTHYTLKYYKIRGKDTASIYFSRDDTADYFIESNKYFDIHVLGLSEEDLK